MVLLMTDAISSFPVVKINPNRACIEFPSSSHKLYISNNELISHGCKNCIWRMHHQCGHGIVSETEFYEFEDCSSSDVDSSSGTGKVVKQSGYCPEYVNFLFSFAEDGDSMSSVWEKFSLYVGRMQTLEDYKSYLTLRNKIADMKNDPNLSSQEKSDMQMKEVMLRMWWEKLNETVIKGYSRIVNREYRLKEPTRTMPGIMNAKVINFNTIQQIDKPKDVTVDETSNIKNE